MEPVSAALLLALATGAAGAAGGQSWQGLVALVRRWRGQESPSGVVEPVSAEAELTSLEQDPADERRAQILSVALAARAGRDAGFAAALEAWHRQAQQVVPNTGAGSVSTNISGGSQGNVVTARDVTGGLHFGLPASPPSPPERPGGSGS
ncbi:hypothetical protein O1Q96_23130 [Streptomyces sp. Qhu-G9]|uniref:hypothetical protein n=1 Tax=Streptomyces sp. Qhu-G9 TaxID=3452799 RepID=UPI0022ABD310|nr:hypothetical protein [Streptomyces aurantiacus]WAU82395.1 hypothetical protein O1Q96_23130 [Streptomyces aurantiacus]